MTSEDYIFNELRQASENLDFEEVEEALANKLIQNVLANSVEYNGDRYPVHIHPVVSCQRNGGKNLDKALKISDRIFNAASEDNRTFILSEMSVKVEGKEYRNQQEYLKWVKETFGKEADSAAQFTSHKDSQHNTEENVAATSGTEDTKKEDLNPASVSSNTPIAKAPDSTTFWSEHKRKIVIGAVVGFCNW